MLSTTVVVCLTAAILADLASAQIPSGYVLIALNDWIEAGPATTLLEDVATLDACTTRCDQDPLCQSIQWLPSPEGDSATFRCALYRLRRCMTPTVHDNVFPALPTGLLLEKATNVTIPASQATITTVCGTYAGVAIETIKAQIPSTFDEVYAAAIANFTSFCTQRCASQQSPACRSWHVFETFENSFHIPASLTCTTYADSIFDTNHGFFSVKDGGCKRARSKYGINGDAISQVNCGAAVPPLLLPTEQVVGTGAPGTTSPDQPATIPSDQATDGPYLVTEATAPPSS